MSSERYDEGVREQKKAERKKQVHKQIVILVIVLFGDCSSCGSSGDWRTEKRKMTVSQKTKQI